VSEVLGEAQIIIRANTAPFLAQIEELRKLVARPVVIPVGTVATGAGTAAAASAATQQQAASTAALTTQEKLFAQALAEVNAAQTADILAMRGVTTEQEALAVANKASATAAKALQAALLTQDQALIANAAALSAAAREQQAFFVSGTGGATSATRGAAKAEAELAGATTITAKATRDGAKAAADQAKHLEQLGRGAGTAGLSFLGLRAQVLAASGAFVGGAAAALIIRKSIAEASSLTEEINKTQVVFGRSAKAIVEWSKTTASSLGIARVAALQAAGQFGAILVPMGVLPQRAAVMSESLVRLASDLASFNNVDPGRALEALRAGLVGQSRPLRVLGVQLTAARVATEAMRESGKKSAADLSQQEKVVARYTLILKDAAIQMGDFAATQNRLANQSRILNAQLADLGGEIGTKVTPAVTDLVRIVNLGVGSLRKLGEINLVPIQPGGTDLKAQAKDVFSWAAGWKELTFLLDKVGPSTTKVSSSIEDMDARLKKTQEDLKGLTGPAGVAALSIKLQDLIAAFARGGPAGKEFAKVLTGILADLQTGRLKVNTKLDLVAIFDKAQARAEVEKKWGVFRDSVERGIVLQPPIEATAKVNVTLDIRTAAAEAAGPSASLAEAKRQQAEALKHLRALLGLDSNASRAEIQAAIDSRKISKTRQDAIGRAFAELSAADSVISAAAGKAASDAQSAKSKQEQAAKDAATAQADATQAFIDAFLGGRETLLRRRLERAGNTDTVADDLRINEGIKRVLKARLKAIQDRIRSLHLHGEALRIAKEAIKTLGDQIASLNTTIDEETTQLANQRQAAAQAALDARQTHLEAILSIAQTTPQTGDDRRALEALIAFDNRRIAALRAVKKRTREQNALLDSYRVDLAQREQALRELTAQQKKTTNAGAELAFSFLQAQQGFAANLLGNLIPGGLTGGLVGGSGGSSGPSPGLRQVSGGFEDPARGLSQQTGRDSGPRASQASTTNHLLQLILRALENLNSRTTHPESRYNRHLQKAAMDGVHGN